MKRYKVSIYTNVWLEAEDQDEAMEKAIDQIESGLIEMCDVTEYDIVDEAVNA